MDASTVIAIGKCHDILDYGTSESSNVQININILGNICDIWIWGVCCIENLMSIGN